jgi:hypothetical protein
MDEILRHTVWPINLRFLIARQNRAKRVNGASGIPVGCIRDSAILNGATVFEIMNATEM